MSSAFDSMYLAGGELITSQDGLLDFVNDYGNTEFTTVNDGIAGNTGTISPHDLMRDDSMMLSAPASTAFPNLSTPDSGYLESPAMASSGLNTSPLEDGLLDGSLNFNELEGMPPLFPQNSFDQFTQHPSSESGPSKNAFCSINSRPSTATSPMVRQKSSPGRPPNPVMGHGRKHSINSGIAKNNVKSRKPLPDIRFDEDDDRETAKRKKNTAAARKSRQRKQDNQEALETEIGRLRGVIYRMGGNPDDE